MASGKIIRFLDVQYVVLTMSFDISGSCLYTDKSIIAIDRSGATEEVDMELEANEPNFVGPGISWDDTWITYNGENIICLPSDYWSHKLSVVSEDAVGVISGSDKILVCRFDESWSTRM